MTTIESARSIRAEYEEIEKQRFYKRNALMNIADSLEQEAAEIRTLVGAVPMTVEVKAPKRKAAAKVPPTKPVRRGGIQPHFGSLRPGGLNARIVGMLREGSFLNYTADEIAGYLVERHRAKVVAAACVTLANKGHILRTAPGKYQAVPK